MCRAFSLALFPIPFPAFPNPAPGRFFPTPLRLFPQSRSWRFPIPPPTFQLGRQRVCLFCYPSPAAFQSRPGFSPIPFRSLFSNPAPAAFRSAWETIQRRRSGGCPRMEPPSPSPLRRRRPPGQDVNALADIAFSPAQAAAPPGTPKPVPLCGHAALAKPPKPVPLARAGGFCTFRAVRGKRPFPRATAGGERPRSVPQARLPCAAAALDAPERTVWELTEGDLTIAVDAQIV